MSNSFAGFNVLENIIGTQMQWKHDQDVANQNQNRWIEQMNYANELQRANMRDSAMLQKRGMQQAGINTAGAEYQANGLSPSSGVDASMASSRMNPLNSASVGAGVAQSLANVEQMNAQTGLIKEQAEAQKIQNNRMKSEDSGSGAWLIGQLTQERDKFEQGSPAWTLYDTMLNESSEDGADGLNAGSLNAWFKAVEFKAQQAESILRQHSAELENKVKQIQLSKPNFAEMIAQMPEKEFELMNKTITEKSVQIGLLMVNKQINEIEKSQRLNKLTAEIESTYQSAWDKYYSGYLKKTMGDKTYNEDNVQQMKNGDVKTLGASATIGVVKAGADILKASVNPATMMKSEPKPERFGGFSME